MEKNVKIEIEQYDNGITLHWTDISGEIEDAKKVFLKKDIETGIGKTIWEDIEMMMDLALRNEVVLNIQYQTKDDKKVGK